MRIIEKAREMQQLSLEWKRGGSRVGLVPTMGCLHEGHLSLVRLARKHCDKVIVSIFVNPIQFGPHEDFEKYPRTFESDCQKLEGADVVFHPGTHDMYDAEFQTRVRVKRLSQHLCGASRPGHFDGVATICTKLFLISQADIAVFGEKDFQQLRVLQNLVRDLNLPLEIIPHPIVRESDGLAMSSRNAYLSPQDRKVAPLLYRSLLQAAERVRSDCALTVGDLETEAAENLTKTGFRIDYLQIAESRDLIPVGPDVRLSGMENPRIFVAAKLGGTRLIDNLALKAGGVPT